MRIDSPQYPCFPLFRFPNSARAFVAGAALLLSAAGLCAQDAAPSQEAKDEPKPVLPHVTTTVEVHADGTNSFLSQAAPLSALDSATLRETPLSAVAITRAVLDNQQARVLTEVLANDASVGQNYAPIGYYGAFLIRGFPVDLATGLQINGLTVAGEQDVPLENKERVEVLKGIAGLESGVSSAGGVIHFVTKRPGLLSGFDLATDHRGSSYGAADVNHSFGKSKLLGTRFNFGGERMMSYLQGTNGWRAMGSAAADWKLSANAILKGDFEYQHKAQRSECGYELLGHATVPDLNRLYPSKMLGYQAWAPKNLFDTLNAGLRFDYSLPRSWRAYVQAGYSRSLIDDNVIYAYGNSLGDPYYNFAADGTYDIYDYRNPGELRKNSNAEAVLAGRVKTGAIAHELAVGGALFARSVRQPESSVFEWIGEENIYTPNLSYGPGVDANGNLLQAGPQVLAVDHHQSALIVRDRMRLPGRVQLVVGGRETWMRDHNFDSGQPFTEKAVWLPQYAAMFNPVEKLTLYANYATMLSLGPQAAWWAANSNVYLDPFFTRQAEAGAKFEVDRRLMLTAAYFRTRAPFFYPKALATPDAACNDLSYSNLCFESSGHETHTGFEFSAQGRAANWLQLNASLAAIDAKSAETGTPSFDDKRVTNIPRVQSTLFADLSLPRLRGLRLMPGWNFVSRKQASRDNLASVGGYNLFNLGVSYKPGGEQGHVTFRVYADNVLNKRYWRDTSSSYGDVFLHIGAPATVRASMHYSF